MLSWFGACACVRRPYDERTWWARVLQRPYETRTADGMRPLQAFLKTIMWRTAKKVRAGPTNVHPPSLPAHAC